MRFPRDNRSVKQLASVGLGAILTLVLGGCSQEPSGYATGHKAPMGLERAFDPTTKDADAVRWVAATEANLEVLEIPKTVRDPWKTLTDIVAGDPRWEPGVWSTGDPYLQFTGSSPDFPTGTITLATDTESHGHTVTTDARYPEVRTVLKELRKRLRLPN